MKLVKYVDLIMKIKIDIRTSNIIHFNTKNFFNLFVICIPPKGVSENPFLCVHVHIVGMTRYQKVTDFCDSYLDRIQEIKEAVVSRGVNAGSKLA